MTPAAALQARVRGQQLTDLDLGGRARCHYSFARRRRATGWEILPDLLDVEIEPVHDVGAVIRLHQADHVQVRRHLQ